MRQQFPRSWKPFAALAISAALFVPLMLFGGAAFAKTGSAAWQYQYGPGSSQYQYGPTTICHHTHSWKHPFVQIRIGAPAVKAHLRHGDELGPCPGQPSIEPFHKGHGDDDGDDDQVQATTTTTTTSTTTTPGWAPTPIVLPYNGEGHEHHGQGH